MLWSSCIALCDVRTCTCKYMYVHVYVDHGYRFEAYMYEVAPLRSSCCNHVLYVTSAVLYMYMYMYMYVDVLVHAVCLWFDKHITEDTERCLLIETSAIIGAIKVNVLRLVIRLCNL